MEKREWSVQVILRYALFQIPSLALIISILILVRQWVDLPGWIFWGSIALWIAKDIILFPFVWRAYDRNRLKELHTLIGAEGIADEKLAPSGYIRVHGEFWRAEVGGDRLPVEKGERVRIQGIRGLKLIVEPFEKERKLTKDSGLQSPKRKGIYSICNFLFR